MHNASFLASILIAAVLGGAAGFITWNWVFTDPKASLPTDPEYIAALPRKPPQPDASVIGTALPQFELKDLDGVTRSPEDYDGKVLVINFWATWCGPCREEMPMLVDLQKKHGDRGLQIIGVALDNLEAVKAFAVSYGVDYPLLLGEPAATRLGMQLGNKIGGIPYTIVVDRNGKVVHQIAGLVEKDSLLPEIERHL